MAPRVLYPQEFFLHDSDWNANLEKEFLLKLLEYPLAGNSTLDRNDVIPIKRSMSLVNQKYRTSLTCKDALQRFKQLKHQHEVFGYLISLFLLHYDEDNNVITALPFMWDYIIMLIIRTFLTKYKYPLIEAYISNGEAQWTDIYLIFEISKPINVFEDREPPRIISRSEVASQNSTQYPPPHNTTFMPNELVLYPGSVVWCPHLYDIALLAVTCITFWDLHILKRFLTCTSTKVKYTTVGIQRVQTQVSMNKTNLPTHHRL
ncbi:hypothetical protein CDL12_02947 [Handroanthus impetiginosus]|uniref:Uncharacterized protein n=1 Tax=Handroanthus impetiginosus TaxID=429701 RepID=A0A2G9I3I9_9LAMI|nr:hypothetical protein CDL12_02947 [Handroanthus impetiginosus]